MKPVLDLIAEKKNDFDQLPLLRRLERPATLEEAKVVAVSIVFFTHSSKDLLHINADLFEDPELRKIAKQHYKEEYAHARWLRRDLATLGIEIDLPTAFGEDHYVDREAGYRLIAESLKARHDSARMALLWVLETTGESFFSRTLDYFRRAGVTSQLVFYGQTHLDAEHGHVLFQDEQQSFVESIMLTDEQRNEAIELSLRCYDAMTDMMNACERMVVEHTPILTPA